MKEIDSYAYVNENGQESIVNNSSKNQQNVPVKPCITMGMPASAPKATFYQIVLFAILYVKPNYFVQLMKYALRIRLCTGNTRVCVLPQLAVKIKPFSH
jgi:hypothetical protein